MNHCAKCIQATKALPALVLVLSGFVSGTACATEDDFGLWGIFSTTDAFETERGPSRWRYWFDAQARYFDVGSGVSQYVLRPGVGYKVSENMSVWVGYGYFYSRTASGATVTENRLWQQLSWNVGRAAGGEWSMRARLEERSISRGDDLGLVLRYMAKYVRPLSQTKHLDFIFSVEPFFDLVDTDWAGDSGLAQVRAAIGVGWKLSPKLAIETGYMNQYIRRDNAENLDNHLGVINFKVKF